MTYFFFFWYLFIRVVSTIFKKKIDCFFSSRKKAKFLRCAVIKNFFHRMYTVCTWSLVHSYIITCFNSFKKSWQINNIFKLNAEGRKDHIYTMCPRSSYPIYIVRYYIKWVTTSWTYKILSKFTIYDGSRLLRHVIYLVSLLCMMGQDFLDILYT